MSELKHGCLWDFIQAGGMLVGTERAAEYLRNSSKPIGAYSDQCFRESSQSGSKTTPDSSTATE
jgi:hypothetical protein